MGDNSEQNAVSGILIGSDKYNKDYLKYEQNFPYAFPWTQNSSSDVPRYIKGDDGYWFNPDAVENGHAVLSCTGDLMGEPKLQNSHKFGDSYFMHPSFQYVRKLFKSTDFVVGNLETTVTDSTPYAGQWHVINGKYHCNSPKSYLDSIRYAGFDALVNANNHNCDSAVTGLIDTIQALDEKGFMHTGTFLPECKERVLYVKVNGIKIAILSYATYFNKLDSNFTKLGKETLLNEYSNQKAVKDVEEARRNGAEFVISYIHWGKEYTHSVSELQKNRAQQLADIGVDYIIGSHSHSLQPYEVLTAKDGRKVPVVYSLGNFLSSDVRKICRHTGILQIVLKKQDGMVVIKNDYFIPCYIYASVEDCKYAVVPTDVTLNGGFCGNTLVGADKYIKDVMKNISPLTTAAISLEEICEVLGAEVPKGVVNKYVSYLCSKIDWLTQYSAYFGIIWNSEKELKSAIAKGACVVITNRKVDGIPCIVVEDVDEAYCKLYAHIKNRFNAVTIAITGSVGKTTTKEIMENVFKNQSITLTSDGNKNTRHTGMLVMQKLRSYHDYYIQEVHEGDPKSADMMSRALSPDYCVITNIDSAHRENFNSQEDFVKCFTDIVNGLKQGGKLLINGDDAELVAGVEKLENKQYDVIKYGIYADDLDYKAENISTDGNTLSLDIVYDGKKTHINFPSPIEKNAYNILAAFIIGNEENIPESKLVSSIEKYESSGIRQNIIHQDGFTLMLDCRSAAPTSMVSSIEAFCKIPVDAGNDRVAVLGDMHLDENESEIEHRKIGEFVAKTNLDYVLCYGEASEYIYDSAIDAGFDMDRIFHFVSKRELELELDGLLKKGDALLIKGGRRMYLNSTIRKLFGITISID